MDAWRGVRLRADAGIIALTLGQPLHGARCEQPLGRNPLATGLREVHAHAQRRRSRRPPRQRAAQARNRYEIQRAVGIPVPQRNLQDGGVCGVEEHVLRGRQQMLQVVGRGAQPRPRYGPRTLILRGAPAALPEEMRRRCVLLHCGDGRGLNRGRMHGLQMVEVELLGEAAEEGVPATWHVTGQ